MTTEQIKGSGPVLGVLGASQFLMILDSSVMNVSMASVGRRRAFAIGLAAAGPLISGATTTFASWRCVFLGEVVIVAAILLFLRRVVDIRGHPRRSTFSAPR